MKTPCGILALLAAIILTACSDNSCYDNGNALPLTQFRFSGTMAKATVSPVTIHGIGAPGDSVLLDSASVSEFYLPLRATVASTQYRISLGDIADTLTISYQPIPQFVSAECGAMYFFRINSVVTTTHAIDSATIAIDDSLVTNVQRVSFYLYLNNP